MLQQKLYLKIIEKIEVLDDSHIAIHQSEPDSSFIYYMKEAIVPDENKDHLNEYCNRNRAV